MKAMAFDLNDFQKEIAQIKKRGSATLALMTKMGASQERLNAEELAISREILHTRIQHTQKFGERLSEIIQEA
jgi:hypothetical protein